MDAAQTAPPYDRYGRMNFHPDFHANHGKKWTRDDIQYLIENYEIDGPEQTSFALERTIHTVMQKACDLRKKYKMVKRTTATTHKRTRQMA